MHFVIAGKTNCSQFTFAIMIAQRLKEKLPNFTYLKITKKPDEWNRWLAKTCADNSWYHISCPLIWREVGLKQGKKEFIEEKQLITVETFSDFEEDQNRPVTDVYIEIQTRKIELYSSSMQIPAHYTGLRYLMFRRPILSAFIGHLFHREGSAYQYTQTFRERIVSLKGDDTVGEKLKPGDINKFLDLCYDYYGVPRHVLSGESFKRGGMEWFTNRSETEFLDTIKFEAKKRREYRSRQVCITGASSQIAEIVVMELLKIPLQCREDGLEIRLFDDVIKEKKLQGSVNDAKYCPGPSGLGNCRVAHTLKEALNNVDLVIVLDSYGRKPKEPVVKWLKRNRNAMCALGKALNMYASPHCRVIIGSPSNQPICYNATVLASFATKLHVRNIVAVTHDLGRETLKTLSAKIGVPLKELYCPPVWGFIGLNKYVDMNKTLQSHVYKVPGKRMTSTLPQGTEESELRMTECIIGDDEAGDITTAVAEFKSESYPRLGRLPCLAKATAILDLLRVWGLKQEDGNGEVLCLGVYSDGTFNIPEGIYWSQPVVLDKGFWIPFADYPIPRNSAINCYYLFLYSVAALYRTKVKPRIYMPHVPEEKLKEKKKFDFEVIANEVGMPVIRSDIECLNYIKYLAKKELDIDFEVYDDTVEEEPEPEIAPTEEIIREQVYCECWRQELKEAQKIVFDRSSTTEVEVDLSSNNSGSEWSVINPNQQTSQSETESGKKRGQKPADISYQKGKGYSEGISKMGKDSLQESLVTVCSCGALSNGSQCRCLDVEKEKEVEKKVKKEVKKEVQKEVQKEVEKESEKESEKEVVEEDPKISTEHFYQEQNAEVFIEDLKDVIYADSYIGDKHVNFDESLKPDDSEKKLFKFYGRKDAIRNKESDLKMKKRIMKYEQGGEMSSTNEEEGEFESKDVEEVSSGTKEEVSEMKDIKFHISVEGTSFDIIGDQDGLENLDEAQKASTDQDSSKSFRQMYTDEVAKAIQMIPLQSDKSKESFSENYSSIPGEGNYDDTNFKIFPEMAGEDGAQQILMSLSEEFEDMDVDFSDEEEKKEETTKEETPVSDVKKRQGIPLCSLCRCIVPEGLPICPCGASTVMEVFKKESLQVFVKSEEDISFRIEYFKTPIPHPESESETSIPSSEQMEEEPPEEKTKKDLPPESFFPFSPKPENKFKETERPKELTKEYIDSLKEKPEKEISKKCAELLEMAKAHLQENAQKSDEEPHEEAPPALSLEDVVDMDYCDPNLFIPKGIEDWRLTVQKKCREWFFEGNNIRDDSYYDIAIEEVSEDEFEIDKELELYFEN